MAKRERPPRRPERISVFSIRRQLGAGMLSAFVLVAVSIYWLVFALLR